MHERILRDVIAMGQRAETRREIRKSPALRHQSPFWIFLIRRT